MFEVNQKSFIMKKLLVVLGIALGTQGFAQVVPEVIKDLDYDVVEILTEDGEPFEAFIVEKDYNTLKKRINKFGLVEVDREGLMLFVVREDETFEYVSSRSFDFKRVTIYSK